MASIQTISLRGSVKDLLAFTAYGPNREVVGGCREGYVPSALHIGEYDDVQVEINVETGQILNWVVPNEREILASLEEQDSTHPIRTIALCGKARDLFRFTAYGANQEVIGNYEGYVPSGLGVGSDDYIQFEYEVATGQIVNWVRPDNERIHAILEGEY